MYTELKYEIIPNNWDGLPAGLRLKFLESVQHELPILRAKRQRVLKELERVEEQIRVCEDLFNKLSFANEQQELSFEELFSKGRANPPDDPVKEFKNEYPTRSGYKEKILFLTDNADRLSYSGYYNGSPDLVKTIYSFEKNGKEEYNQELLSKLEANIPAVLSRLFKDGLLLKYREKGSKKVFVPINKNWAHEDGTLKQEYAQVLFEIEPASMEENEKSPNGVE